MGTNQKYIYYSQEYSYRDLTHKKEPDMEFSREKEIMPEPKPVQKQIPLNKTSSMSNLIIWNISKALEMKPSLDLKGALVAAKQRLDTNAQDLGTVSEKHPEQQHLICALLAWQRLGHHDADSLYRFVAPKKNEISYAVKCVPKLNNNYKDQNCSHESTQSTINGCQNPAAWKAFFTKPSVDGSFGWLTGGPIVKLPVETKLIMRVENKPAHQCCKYGTKQIEKHIEEQKEGNEETLNKINACADTLAALDKKTSDLRLRACQLARREAERVQLLERAEAAWKDLEVGYEKRIALTAEKEDDLKKQVEKLVAERNSFKDACPTLGFQLKKQGEGVEQVREKLTELEQKVCALASTKLRLSEEAARTEASVAENLCKAAQFDRDLKYKEEQELRKLESLETEADSARTLMCEAERAMRAELAGLREQISNVTKELIAEQEANVIIKKEHDKLRQEKAGLIEDLEGCKAMCDKKMKGQLDELMKKKEKLLGMQDKVLECRCTMINKKVQVKRTPSLAALCTCRSGDEMPESCSCTSLRGTLLSNLLSDLFGGLQAELGDAGSQMPCQLLKCLEDQHNWDRSSATKTNLRNFFSKLLKNELDIAIVTSIENYHAKWIGSTCADVTPRKIGKFEQEEECQEIRAREICVQEIQEAAEDTESSKSPRQSKHAAVYSCLMPVISPFNRATSTAAYPQTGERTPPASWEQTIQDVTQLKLQLEDLKKESIKKEDLKIMEENILIIVKNASVQANEDPSIVTKDTSKFYGESIKKEAKYSRTPCRVESPKTSNQNKLGASRWKDSKSSFKKGSIYEKPTKQSKRQSHGQSYAVNLCLCAPQKNVKSLQNAQLNSSERTTWKQRSLKDIMPQSSIVKQTKPININLPSSELQEDDSIISDPCNSNCKCFHKMPSNTSIDRLLQTLASWKYDLVPREKCVKNIKSNLSKCSKTEIKETITNLIQSNSKINLSQVNVSDIYKDTHMKTDQRHRQCFKQPATIESEYMGAVYLDKSHENACTCITSVESSMQNNQEKCEDGTKNIPFQCINTNTCNCNITQDMQKDHKRSQTEEFHKLQIQSNQCQVTWSNDVTESNELIGKPKSSNYTNSQIEIKQTPDMNSIHRKAELFSSSGGYIKFLGVTLDDLSSNKKTKIKTVDHNLSGLIIPKDKHVKRQRKLSKKLSNIKQSNSLTKLKVLTKERHDQSICNDCTKRGYKAKFEEFTSFMNNFFDNTLHEKALTDEVIDSQNLKFTDNTIEPCVCCSSVNVDDSRDLEVNAFHLLEDHIKEKFEEFKSFSCKSKCISPEEEEKLFSTILQRVKQVISDCANKMKCGCPGGIPNNGSWNRAYGLLQEYLKIKIKRVQCLCVLNERKDVILPEVLEKVCNLIENDFQRLKDICTCKDSTDTRTKTVCIGDLKLPPTELPEKDTNISQAKYNDVKVENFSKVTKFLKENSNNSMILKQNISSQVPPNLGMEAKSCDIMRRHINRDARTTETDHIITDSKSNGVMYNTCDCSYNTDKVEIRKFPDMFETKEVLVNFYAEQATNTSDFCKLPKIDIEQEPPEYLLPGKAESMRPILKIEMSENDESKLDAQNRVVNRQTPCTPYIGYTVDCSCDEALGSCFCMKSVIQANYDKINSLWKGFLINSNQNFPYIMHGTQNQNSDDVVNRRSASDDILSDGTLTTAVPNDDKFTLDAEIIAESENDMVLKYSLENVNFNHQAANTVDECLSLETTISNNDFVSIDWIKSPEPDNSVRSNAVNLANSIYFPRLPIDNETNSFIIDTATNAQKTTEICDCDKVPICHVKMLVEHIEKNLVESKCTCDSLISKVCPVHSKRVL